MYPSSNDIFSITYNVLDTMLNVEAEMDAALASPTSTPDLTGCIEISGVWTGVVMVQVTDQLARWAASRMLSIGLDKLAVADVHDALAELTNMIGGNIKSQVPGPSDLSLPSVSAGGDREFFLARSKTLNDISLCVQREPMRVLLCEFAPERMSACVRDAY